MNINRGGRLHRRNMYLLMNHQMVKVHRVTKLAFFRNRLLGGTMGFDVRTIGAMLVAIQYNLPCDKNYQQQPGVDYMEPVFFQQR
jgi:hypothetical protein